MANKLVFGLFAALFWVGTTEGEDTCCPDSWTPYHGSCYLFHNEEKMDWTSAVTYCNQRQGDLASVETENENKFLKYYATKLYNEQSNLRNSAAFWLGASDLDIEGVWKWVSKDEEVTYNDWNHAANQPNTDQDNHEDCLLMPGIGDFRWYDAKCGVDIAYPLCEKRGSGSHTGVAMQIIG